MISEIEFINFKNLKLKNMKKDLLTELENKKTLFQRKDSSQEAITKNHAASGKFGNKADFSEEIDLNVNIDHEKKEITLTDVKDYHFIEALLKLHKDYLVIIVTNGSATTFGTADKFLEKLNSKVVTIHILEKDLRVIGTYLDNLGFRYVLEDQNKTVQDFEDGINKFI